MGNPSQEELYPKSLVLPHFTSSVRNTLLADIGTMIYNTTTSKVNMCKAKAAGDTNWEEMTSVQES